MFIQIIRVKVMNPTTRLYSVVVFYCITFNLKIELTLARLVVDVVEVDDVGKRRTRTMTRGRRKLKNQMLREKGNRGK